MKWILILAMIASSNLFARDFEKIIIPNAQCGNGLPYYVFYDAKASDKLAIEFMGGGACWSFSTCKGPNFRTWINQIPKLPVFSTMSSKVEEYTPLTKHSYLYFPYCTGDVYTGRHIGKYAFGAKTYHVGYNNIGIAMDHLIRQGIIDPDKVRQLTLYGASAGALGSLIHGKNMERIFTKATSKKLIANSPGLHWGEEFWEKFTPELIEDITDALAAIGLQVSTKNGMLADNIPDMCDIYKDWELGLMQSSKDLVMTYLFGDLTPKEHERLVYSAEGMYEQSKLRANCAAFVPNTRMHTFMLLPRSARINAGDKSAKSFVFDIYNQESTPSYRD